MKSPAAKFAIAALPIGLATVFIPDHSPRALVIFVVSHSLLGLAMLSFSGGRKNHLGRWFGYIAGFAVGLAGLAFVIPNPAAVAAASITAIAWSALWMVHWLIVEPRQPSAVLESRDRFIQLGAASIVLIALVMSFGDPVASTGFAGVYLVAVGLHLAIVAASPKVG